MPKNIYGPRSFHSCNKKLHNALYKYRYRSATSLSSTSFLASHYHSICVWSIQKISFKPFSEELRPANEAQNWYKKVLLCHFATRGRRPLLQLHSLASYYQATTNFLLRLFRQSISQSIFNKKISTNIWLKASQQGRSFKPLKSGFGFIGRLYYWAIILLVILLVITRSLKMKLLIFWDFSDFFLLLA